MSLAVFALLICALNFVFRELYMDVFITQTALDKVVVKDEYIDIWMVGLRYDAKLAYYLMLPGIVVSLLGALGPAFFRLCLKIIGVWVTLSAAWLMASTCANIHVCRLTRPKSISFSTLRLPTLRLIQVPTRFSLIPS